MLIGANVLVAVMLIGAGTVYGYANWRFAQIRRILLPHMSGAGSAGGPINILVVGSDTRAGLTGADAAQFGSAQAVAGARSDTIMLVHVDPASTKATLLSIPRDLWVQIPGKSFQQRINTTFDTGPDLLAQAVEQDLGIPINHYVEVNFESFRQVVNAVGGINEYFPTPARDAFSLLNIPNPGCYTMNGDKALSFVRSRHYEYKVNGRWVSEASSDLARIKRQQTFIKKVISKAQGSGLTNPIALNNIVGGVTNNLTLDKGFSRNLLLSLAKRFRSLSPDTLPTATLPTTPAHIQGNDVLLLDQPKAQQAINDFLGQSQAAPPTSSGPSTAQPGEVRMNVLNGSGRGGEAAQAATGLQHLGFNVVSSHSANNFSYPSSIDPVPPRIRGQGPAGRQGDPRADPAPGRLDHPGCRRRAGHRPVLPRHHDHSDHGRDGHHPPGHQRLERHHRPGHPAGHGVRAARRTRRLRPAALLATGPGRSRPVPAAPRRFPLVGRPFRSDATNRAPAPHLSRVPLRWADAGPSGPLERGQRQVQSLLAHRGKAHSGLSLVPRASSPRAPRPRPTWHGPHRRRPAARVLRPRPRSGPGRPFPA